MKRKLIDLPTRWGYYLIGIAAGFGVTAGLLQSPIGMFILLPALPLLCIILALVFTLRQRTADVLLPLLLLLGMAAAFQLWCVAEHESSWLTLLRAFFWPCILFCTGLTGGVKKAAGFAIFWSQQSAFSSPG